MKHRQTYVRNAPKEVRMLICKHYSSWDHFRIAKIANTIHIWKVEQNPIKSLPMLVIRIRVKPFGTYIKYSVTTGYWHCMNVIPWSLFFLRTFPYEKMVMHKWVFAYMCTHFIIFAVLILLKRFYASTMHFLIEDIEELVNTSMNIL